MYFIQISEIIYNIDEHLFCFEKITTLDQMSCFLYSPHGFYYISKGINSTLYLPLKFINKKNSLRYFYITQKAPYYIDNLRIFIKNNYPNEYLISNIESV